MLKDLLRERRRSLAVRGLSSRAPLARPNVERLVNAAASAFNAPIATMSLIRGNEQAIKAGYGFPVGCIPRNIGFCSFTLDSPGILECCDPQGDSRFAMLPGVLGEPHIRYYIGAPLRLTSGIKVGALCVVDTVRRDAASDDQKAYFLGLTRQAAISLEQRLDLWGHAA